jgi:hypothetical protein
LAFHLISPISDISFRGSTFGQCEGVAQVHEEGLTEEARVSVTGRVAPAPKNIGGMGDNTEKKTTKWTAYL